MLKFVSKESIKMVLETQKLELILMLQDEELLAKVKSILKNNVSKTKGSATSILNKDVDHLRQFGFAKGLITNVAPDFDETPPGFEEYMPEA